MSNENQLFECGIQPRPLEEYSLHDYHIAPGAGPLHYTWTDKPHRLLYDLIAAVRYYAAIATQRQAEPAEDGDYYSEEADDIEQSRRRAEVTDTQRDAVARAICIACDEGPDFPGNVGFNEFRWQDYRDVADAAIQAMQKDTQ
jgi:hypothetical protein